MLSRNYTRAPRSPSYSPMDSLPPSEMDHAERMAIESNKMDFETTNQEIKGLYSSFPNSNTLQPLSQNKVVSNNTAPSDPSTVPVTPSAIPYKANSPVDPNLWDGHFGSVSLFGTNEFLQSDVCNISCSLICIAQFIRQRNISNCDGNMLPQLSSFGDATFDFILAIHKAGWYKLNTSDNTPIGNKIKGQFGNQLLSRWTINFGNISDIWNIIIIINGSQERNSSSDITTRSLVMYLRTLSE